jgi:type VII secretion integral membrane protein EccD
VLTSYSRVTVVSGARRVDIALPSALPLADVLPQVMRFCAPEESPHTPAELSLAKVGGQPLAMSQTLAESGVHDGDVIELRSIGTPNKSALVEDVRDSLEDAVDEAGGGWTSRSTATFAIITLSVVLGLVLLAGARTLFGDVLTQLLNSGDMGAATMSAVDAVVLTNTVAATAVLIVATWVASRYAAPWSVYVSSAMAALWATMAGADLAQAQTSNGFAQLLSGILAGSLVAGGCRLISRRAIPLFVTTVLWFVVAAVLVVLQATTIPIGAAARVIALLAVLGIGIMPRMSIAVGGLSSADYRVRNAGRMSESALTVRVQESSGLLLGALYGTAVIAGVIGAALAFYPGWWDRATSASIAVALLLRSRVFSRIQHMLPLRIAAIGILTAQAIAGAQRSESFANWFVAAISGVGAVAIAVSIVSLSDITRARIKRLLNAVEFIVIVDLIVVTMGAIGLYDRYAPR